MESQTRTGNTSDFIRKERARAASRKSRAKRVLRDPGYESRKSKEQRERHLDAYKLRDKKNHLLRSYGLTLEAYEQWCARVGNRCEICGGAPKKLVVDHNHATGKVRGLLCRRCNSVLHEMENPVWKKSSEEYLESR